MMQVQDDPAKIDRNILRKLSEPLPVDSIEFRVQSISPSGWATLLAYKDARVDMQRLDEVCGPGFWQRKHERVGNDLYCSVGVWNAVLQQWVWVQDVGIPSNESATKGEASDSFKRACFNLGIGRELYDMPLILVQLHDNEFFVEEFKGKRKGKATYDLKLRDWTWHFEYSEAEGLPPELTKLVAIDQHRNTRYTFTTREDSRSARQGDVYQYADEDRDQNAPQQQGAQQQGQQRSGGNRQQRDNRGGQRNDYRDSRNDRSQQRNGNRSNGNQLPWYDGFDDDVFAMQKDLHEGVATHDSIINDLKGRYRLNRKTEEAIRNL
jgi:hypothetical protein